MDRIPDVGITCLQKKNNTKIVQPFFSMPIFHAQHHGDLHRVAFRFPLAGHVQLQISYCLVVNFGCFKPW